MAIGVFNGNFRAGDYRRYRQQIEADAKNPRKALERIEENLMLECIALEGDKFVEYWDSDAVPAFGFIQDRIDLLRARIANLQSQPNPIDEAQAIELEIDAKLDSASERNDSIISRDWQADAIAEAEFDADTKQTYQSAYYDFTPFPSMPDIDFGNIDEIPF